MTQAGRWLTIAFFALAGVGQVVRGVGYLSGLWQPGLEGVAVPAGMEGSVVKVAGVVALVVGLLHSLVAWGIYAWRSWARIVAIVLSLLALGGLVVMSFTMALPFRLLAAGGLTILVLLWLFSSRVGAAFAAGGRQEP